MARLLRFMLCLLLLTTSLAAVSVTAAHGVEVVRITAPAVNAQLTASQPVPLAGEFDTGSSSPWVQRVALSVRNSDTGAYHAADGTPVTAFRTFDGAMTTDVSGRPISFSNSIRLAAGTYTLRVRAVFAGGGDVVLYRAFRVLAAPDAEPPVLRLTSPAVGPGAVVTEGPVFAAVVSDDVAGPSVRVTLTIRDAATYRYWNATTQSFTDDYVPYVQHVTADPGGTPVSFSIPLPDGQYSMSMIARDAAGRQSPRVGGKFQVAHQ